MKRALLILACLLALSAVLAPPAEAGSVSWHDRTSTERLWSLQMRHVLNHERANHGLRLLWHSPTLHRAARHHNFHMAEVNTMSHCLSFERCMIQRDVYWGFTPWCWLGENIGWIGPPTLDNLLQLQRLLFRSEEHRANILSPHYHMVAISVWIDRAHDKVWVTQDFGRHVC